MVLKLFNLDLHISVIEDVKDILYRLFGNSIEITNWSISGHNWVMNKPTPSVQIINQHTWCSISPSMVQEFQNYYDGLLSQFDGFIVTHTPVFALLYEKYNKPIIMVNSCRYDQPFCWNISDTNWRWLSCGLKRLWENNLLIPISNNKADQAYLKLGTGIDSIHIPSLCLYTKSFYNPIHNKFICYGDRNVFPECDLLLPQLKGGYTWTELYNYKGIVHNPYEISTMSLFEQYSANVPLFLPSKEFYKKCILERKMELISVYNNGQGYIPLLPAYKSPDFWLDNADYYDDNNFKYIYFYDSFEDLIEKITNFNESDEIKEKRRAWIETRKNNIFEIWKKILDL